MTGATPLLRAENLRAAYDTGEGSVVAVDDTSVQLFPGSVLGIAGESGCGKSTLAAVLSLTARAPLHVLSGRLEVQGETLNLGDDAKTPRRWRGSVVSLLPQGAMNALSPTLRIRDFAYDVLRAHEPKTKRSEAIERTRERLEQLDLPARVLDTYPHQLSGGMKQRVVTCLSTLLNPRLLIADEPTSALDVSSQRVLIEMLKGMLEQQIISGVIFVTHDLPVLGMIADRIAIMYAGKIAELGPTDDVIERPRHPYSGDLLQSVLVPEKYIRERRVRGIRGAPPNLLDPPPGCRFHPRCELAMQICATEQPPEVVEDDHLTSCWWAKEHPGQTVSPTAPADSAHERRHASPGAHRRDVPIEDTPGQEGR